jgi:hypothetical protein
LLLGPADALLPGQVPLDRIKTPLDDLPENVRGHEINSPGPFREGLPDTLQASAEARRQPDDELAILGGTDDRPGH